MSIRLSKSKFVAGCQCLKRLYFQVHQPELAAQPDDSAATAKITATPADGGVRQNFTA